MARHFLHQANRDAEYHRLLQSGFRPEHLVRRTSRGTRLHPMFIEDWEGPEKDETGFGNSLYDHMHPVLYHIEERWEHARE